MTELVLTFRDANGAIMGERRLLDSGIAVRVMPMPPTLGPACGIALRVDEGDAGRVLPLLGDTLAAVYCRRSEGGKDLTPWKP